MKTLNKLRAASVATLAVAAVSLPTLAQAADYRHTYDRSAECRSQENDAQLAGGIIGAVVGGVVGSQVSGNGARTEGSAIGAVVGGLAGAAIGDESVDCDKNHRNAYRNDGYSTYGTQAPIITVGHNTGYNDYRYDDRSYRNHGQWKKERRQLEKQLRTIDKRQYKVKRELKELHNDKNYLPRWKFKQIRSELYAELDSLNNSERRIRRKLGYTTVQYNRGYH